MPSRAARWISWIVLRSNVADSRSPGCQPGVPLRRLATVSNSVISVLARVVDVEVVEPARRAVAPEVLRAGAGHAGALEQRPQLGDVLVAHLLLDAVGA